MPLLLVLGIAALAQEGVPLAREAGTVEAVLDNGLEVTLVGDPDLSLCAVVHYVGVGAAHEAPGEEGAAHFVEHLMFEPSEGGLWDSLDGLGARANATTSHDATVYEVVLPPEGIGELLELEAARFTAPQWDDTTVERERGVVLDELRLRGGTEPAARLGAQLRSKLYPGHPYGRPTGGTAAQVTALDAATLAEFHRRWYRAGQIHLVVVGPHDPMALLDVVEANYASLPEGRTEARVPRVSVDSMPTRIRVGDPGFDMDLGGWVWLLPPHLECEEGVDVPCTEQWWTDQLVLALLAGQGKEAVSDAASVRWGEYVPAFVDSWQGSAGGHVMVLVGQPSVRTTMVRDTIHVGYRAWIDYEGLARLQSKVLRQELERSWFARERALAIAHRHIMGGDDLSERAQGAMAVTERAMQRRFREVVVESRGIKLHVR